MVAIKSALSIKQHLLRFSRPVCIATQSTQVVSCILPSCVFMLRRRDNKFCREVEAHEKFRVASGKASGGMSGKPKSSLPILRGDSAALLLYVRF